MGQLPDYAYCEAAAIRYYLSRARLMVAHYRFRRNPRGFISSDWGWRVLA